MWPEGPRAQLGSEDSPPAGAVGLSAAPATARPWPGAWRACTFHGSRGAAGGVRAEGAGRWPAVAAPSLQQSPGPGGPQYPSRVRSSACFSSRVTRVPPGVPPSMPRAVSVGLRPQLALGPVPPP